MNRGLKLKLLTVVTSLTLLASTSVSIFAEEVSTDNYAETVTYAEKFMKNFKKNVDFDNPVKLYNLDNELVSLYLADKNGGYIIINVADNSVPEFSVKSKNNYISNDSKKHFYNGPLVYMESNNENIIDSVSKDDNGKLSDFKSKVTNVYRPSKKKSFTKETINSTDKSSTVTAASSSFVYIDKYDTVPNYSYNTKKMCGCTASAMLLKYYDINSDSNIVPSYLEGTTVAAFPGRTLIRALIPYVQVGGKEDNGSTDSSVKAGLKKYLSTVANNSNYAKNVTMTDSSIRLIMTIVGKNRPYLLELKGDPKYKNHWVTGYGYYSQHNIGDYAMVNDGWGNADINIDVNATSGYAKSMIYI